MPCERKPMRYGHSEGHTDVCFDEHGKCIVTCGSDGDVRIWESLDDDDPKSINVGEKAYSVALKGRKLVTAVSNNTVQIHTYPDGDPDGILTRFTTNANHVTFNSSGTRVAAGSSDFMIKVIEVMDSSQQKTLRGHDAPVLSVTFDPADEYVASSSCDSSVVVWSIEEQTQVANWKVLQKSSDVSNAKSLCRLAWQGSGKLLAVPVDTTVQLYERDSWNHVGMLSDDLLTQQVVNVVVWSPCGKFLAAGTVGGTLCIWDVEAKLCIERQKHEKGFTVCGMAWHPAGGQIAYTDTEGCLGLLDGVCVSSSSSSSSTSTKNTTAVETKEQNGYDDLFDEDDGGLLDECRSVSGGEADDDDLMPSARKPRTRANILDDDENSRETGSMRADPLADDDGQSDIFPTSAPPAAAAPAPPPRPVYEGPMPTVPQRAFQPGSTPVHLMHRFMVWNSVGIVRSYNDEQDNAIDVEFHDTAVHHAMHLTNTLEHVMADLSQEAVLLACEGTDELASKLQCLHFSSWDTNKEWIVDLPKGEDVRALCLGQGWAAVATSAMLVRLFSIGGVQREIFSLPGPAVCMAGHGEQLLIVYHRGTGFDGDQALAVQLLQLGPKRRQIIHGEALPISRKSHLAWMGFSAEGTPCAVDSEGKVRMLNRSMGNTWTPVCNTRESCKSRSDHYWVVGIHENPQQLRCIPCKGVVFPPTLPRPAVAILPFQMPFCQTSTEKGQMEEQYWRSVLFHNHFDFLSSTGYETDQESQRQQEKEQQELLMKMFALSCKLEREFRCVELAEMMTQNVVTLAIRYASRSRRMLLAQRLNELALEKASQLQVEAEPEDEAAHHSQARNSRFNHAGRIARVAHEDSDEEQQEDHEPQDEPMESEEGPENKKSRVNPFIKGTKSPEKPSVKPVSKEGRVNPFKVSGSGKPFSSSPQPRATNVLDTMTASNRKLTASSKAPVLKPLAPKPRSKAQATLLKMSASKGAKKPEEKELEKPRMEKPEKSEATPVDNVENTRPKTGFQLWLEENRKNILADNPDLEEMDVIKEAMSRFRTLPGDERLMWTEKAKGSTGEGADLKKRKRDEEGNNEADGQEDTDENSAKKKKPSDASAKLSAFAFNKN
ncbi:WD repeat and HMG-box DNA-binding protein 1 isoform X1 [Silurus meridionalis]|uniref:WD repeat and HMG-box DNA-binding protein 1 isoform X1 n=1 Tax=Silurus meridionalis TaxID=175797 RepID=UPI001EEC4950|nr:WD repeat and HMG-box DNA-binding protein 1 isoform X1 [Silurus meridionalis]XP_046711731.1 WD repeat and HMG-box DNA-binding protein 1 isoform X1 [Silurus meridionalis]